MGLPRTLQNLMLFNEGQSYVGEVKTVTLPTLTRKLEEYRGGGMSAPVKLDMGMEALEMKSVFGGPERAMLRQFGVVRVNGVYLRFVGFYQQQDTGQSDTIEIVVRGRHAEIEMGDQELGSAADFGHLGARLLQAHLERPHGNRDRPAQHGPDRRWRGPHGAAAQRARPVLIFPFLPDRIPR
jgi:P2 family phage contractile tail tube protein